VHALRSIKAETSPLPSAELVEYLSGLLVRDFSDTVRWLPRRFGDGALFGGEVLICADWAYQLNLGPSVKEALSYFQLDGALGLHELGLSVVDELGFIGERSGAWELTIGEPKALVQSHRDGQAVMSSACRSALYQATLLAAYEGLEVVPSALFFLTLALSSSMVNRIGQRALVIDEGRLFSTNSTYDDFQRRFCQVPLEEFLASETPLSARYATDVEAIVSALFDGSIPEFQFPTGFIPLSRLLVEQGLAPGGWEPGKWRPVVLSDDSTEILRLSNLLSRRGMLYQSLPNKSHAMPRYLYARSEDMRHIWANFRGE
jgi:hypothetical protein